MANVAITQLPTAQTLTGLESVPVVQNGVTVQTTTGAIANSPVLNQTFLTVGLQPTLGNSRYFTVGPGMTVVDGGPEGPFSVELIDAPLSLVSSPPGFQVKTNVNTLVNRSITVGNGLSVTDGDGIAGDPLIAYAGLMSNLAALSGTGLIAINGTLATPVVLTGTTDQINVANGDGSTGAPTFSLAASGVVPGSYTLSSITVDATGRVTSASSGTAPGTGTVTQIDTGTGLTGGPITSTGTISLADTAVVPATYGSSNYVPTFSVDQQGRLTMAGETEITPAGIGAVQSVSGTANEITATGTTDVTLSLPSALTFTGKTVTNGTFNMAAATVGADTVTTNTAVQTLTNKTLASPAITGTLKLTGTGASAYTPFVQTFASFVSNFNGYQLNYIQNTNNGADASVDYVAYNDASDVDSYFIDMGIASTNYTNPIFTIFPANGGYVYTGGGTSGQASALLLGTSNAASDITLFTGGTLLANTRATIKGNTGNFLIGTTTDTGYKLNVNGATYFGGASTFGSTVLLNADPTLALQAATKQYVDNQVTAGLHIHEPVRVETTGNLTASYTQGGTTFNITDITGGKTLTTSVNHGLSLNDQIWLYTTAGNGLSINTAYFVYSTPALNQITVSLTFNGAEVTGLTNATGLAYNTRANSGVGSKLTNSGTQVALTIDTIPMALTNRVMVRLQTNAAENGVYTVTAVGSGATNWELTRATDSNQVNPADPNGVGTGDYYFTREGLLNAGDSHVLTTEPNTMILGYTGLTFTQFSGGITYTGGTNIDVTGQVISLTGTVAATNGGTGTATVATGDLLYGSATDTWSKLPLGIAYKSLIVNASGTQMEWNAIPLNQTTAVSGQLSVSNGGTGASTLTGYVVGTGTSALTASATIPNTDITGLGTMSTQNANAVAVTGGTINGTTIGATTATTGAFTTVTATTGIFGGTF